MLLARLGHDVVVLDQASFPERHHLDACDRPQQRGPAPPPLQVLLNTVTSSREPAIRQVTFHALGESVSRTIKHKAGVDLFIAAGPYVLEHGSCRGRPHTPGADVRHGVTVTGVRRDRRGRVAGVYGHDRGGAGNWVFGARYVVGIDGLRSRVAHPAGAAINEARPAVGAIQYAYYAGVPWTSMRTSWPNDPSPASSRPTTGRRASGSARPPTTQGGPPPGRVPLAAFGELLEPPRRSWPTDSPRLSRPRRCGVIGLPNHIRHPVRPRLGSRRRRRVPPRCDHGPRHQRRLP